MWTVHIHMYVYKEHVPKQYGKVIANITKYF